MENIEIRVHLTLFLTTYFGKVILWKYYSFILQWFPLFKRVQFSSQFALINLWLTSNLNCQKSLDSFILQPSYSVFKSKNFEYLFCKFAAMYNLHLCCPSGILELFRKIVNFIKGFTSGTLEK